MSNSADCFASTFVRPDGLVLADKLVAGIESRHPYAHAAGADHNSMVVDKL
ncbi:MAG: hypothetical protein ACJAYX_003019 [Planctomycetota bacterium]